MNLWLRLLWLLLTARFRPRLAPPFAVSRLRFRVLPNDLDVNAHMNNGRYFTIMDLGRLDLMLRTGLAATARRMRWMPVLSAAKARFRRELRPFQAYRLETRILWWSDTQFVMEHRFIAASPAGGETAHCVALLLGGLYARAERRFVPVERLFASMGVADASPPATPEVEAFLAAERALKRA
ncbi:MAG TPA: thioesterase family protein [Beijerinckiaceae bacterium]|jgi:acyl-CoA thioesterase FadM